MKNKLKLLIAFWSIEATVIEQMQVFAINTSIRQTQATKAKQLRECVTEVEKIINA